MAARGFAGTPPPSFQSYLHKQGDDLRGKWAQRWFVLSPRDGTLSYYKQPPDATGTGTSTSSPCTAPVLAPSGSIHVSAIRSCAASPRGGGGGGGGGGLSGQQKHCFEVQTTTERGDYVLAAKSRELMLQWCETLEAAMPAQAHAGFLMKRGVGLT